MSDKLNNTKVKIELCSENIAIILNVLEESTQKTKQNINLQDKKALNTGIPTEILNRILLNKERALKQLKTEIYGND